LDIKPTVRTGASGEPNFVLFGDTVFPNPPASSSRLFHLVCLRGDTLLETSLNLHHCGRCDAWRYHTNDRCTLLPDPSTGRLKYDVRLSEEGLEDLFDDLLVYYECEECSDFPMDAKSYSITGDLAPPSEGSQVKERSFWMRYKNLGWDNTLGKRVLKEYNTKLKLGYCHGCKKWMLHTSGRCLEDADSTNPKPTKLSKNNL